MLHFTGCISPPKRHRDGPCRTLLCRLSHHSRGVCSLCKGAYFVLVSCPPPPPSPCSSSQSFVLHTNAHTCSLFCPFPALPRCFRSMFCEMFRHLPVCSVIHDKVLVIHGGLFHREGITLDDIDQVRSRRSVCDDEIMA